MDTPIFLILKNMKSQYWKLFSAVYIGSIISSIIPWFGQYLCYEQNGHAARAEFSNHKTQLNFSYLECAFSTEKLQSQRSCLMEWLSIPGVKCKINNPPSTALLWSTRAFLFYTRPDILINCLCKYLHTLQLFMLIDPCWYDTFSIQLLSMQWICDT